jgi:hypothetical protein
LTGDRDGHGCTRIKNKGLIRVHPCESVAQIGFFRILLAERSTDHAYEEPAPSR